MPAGIITAISALLPIGIKLAEALFPKGEDNQPTGVAKKAYVLRLCELFYDRKVAQSSWNWIGKEVFMINCEVLIDHLVPEIVGQYIPYKEGSL